MFTCSGYGIAAKALTAVIRAYDGRGPQTMLTHTILHELKYSSPDELIGYLNILSILYIYIIACSPSSFILHNSATSTWK